MKKIIMIISVMLVLAGCSAEKYTPVINEDFKASAIYNTGDFSFSCDIEKTGNTVSISPSSTRAKGMVISCNGKEVIFKRNNLVKAFEIGEISKRNPAVLLHQVFSSLESADVKLIDNCFTYTGNCSLGEYILKQAKDNSFVSLSFPQADIEIDF